MRARAGNAVFAITAAFGRLDAFRHAPLWQAGVPRVAGEDIEAVAGRGGKLDLPAVVVDDHLVIQHGFQHRAVAQLLVDGVSRHRTLVDAQHRHTPGAGLQHAQHLHINGRRGGIDRFRVACTKQFAGNR